MTEVNIKEIIVKVYSNLIEENINSWLKAEEALKESKMTPQEQLNLREKIRTVATKISSEFADIVINKGFPTNNITRDETKAIISKLIEKYREELKNDKSSS